MPKIAPLDGKRDWIAQARLYKQLRQDQLAELCGTTGATICRIERGELTPNVRLGLTICDALNVDPHMFLRE